MSSVVGVPGRRQAPVGALHRGHLALAVLPRGEHRQEDVGAGRGTSRQRVGRFSNIVIEYRLTQNRFCAEVAQQREAARGRCPASARARMSVPVGAFASKSRPITAVNCSKVSRTEKSSSPRTFAGKTSRPLLLITNGFTRHLGVHIVRFAHDLWSGPSIPFCNDQAHDNDRPDTALWRNPEPISTAGTEAAGFGATTLIQGGLHTSVSQSRHQLSSWNRPVGTPVPVSSRFTFLAPDNATGEHSIAPPDDHHLIEITSSPDAKKACRNDRPSVPGGLRGPFR